MYCRNCGAAVNEKAEVCMSCGVRPLNGNKFCQECGAETSEKQEICTKCGCRLVGAGSSGVKIDGSSGMVYPSDPPKSPTTATLLSCFITGIGQIYLGQTLKGIVWLIGGILLSLATGGILALPIWIAVMVDAYRIGKKLESGQPVGQWEFF
ncbi:MAG: TM2 domain-containing protein [Firmicutes bacterium]|nr:TM2 domain-containing protein [Bacillota bacterium]